MQKVSNHFVPQFYLKNFSNNKKSIGMYNIGNKRYVKEASIKKQACKDYLYGDDGTIEDMFMDLENECSKIIKNIIATEQIPNKNSQEYSLLILFILLCEARNLKMADSFNNLIDKQAKISLKMKANKNKSFKVPIEAIEKSKISFNIPNLYSIRAIAETYPIIMDLKAILMVSKSERHFITSDNPLVRYNQMYVQRQYKIRGYGLANMGLQLFFPISPKLCICIFDHILYDFFENKEGIIEVYKGKQLDEINKLIYLNSYNTIFFNDKVHLTYINKIIKSTRHSNSELEKEITVLGPEDNKIIGYSPRKVSEKINLPFFKLNRNFINMSLPLHMAGPIRPHAEKYMMRSKKK
ncbi:DUF4238 domain-containing protein [Bacillus sp. ISL-47]|uniref:DUF4238 domain-containing protein n=1 Tax=Bacillus sp. ISL-47 TaxID=2819130 RepID=UPI001BECB222|nr:DUF4238 domain-containing protein [Bacillus sp. ISL-47]MBT2687277.1 DUF4238 domain-containing protein [Bacillus sp. ISL-47]MBT2706653.1 DUF4238 domain-containing protein [Pseudomonas sp. ISL-84]